MKGELHEFFLAQAVTPSPGRDYSGFTGVAVMVDRSDTEARDRRGIEIPMVFNIQAIIEYGPGIF